MKGYTHIIRVLIIVSAVFLFLNRSGAQTSFDSLKIKMPKHYFQTIIIMDGYRKPDQDIKDSSNISKRLKTYGVNQFIFSLNMPVATIDRPSTDSSIRKNTHFLLTANYMRLQPVFKGIPTHNLVKLGVGTRVVINTGKKAVWFVDVSPFITKDVTYPSDPYFRLASTIVYSHNSNAHFNWRIGITKSFLWGNRNYLPFVGLRFGRLDEPHVSIQFPRSINIHLPVNNKLVFNIYTKPQGGMFNFSNHDSVYFFPASNTFHFTRYEINSGLRADVRANSWFNFYVAAGLSTRNNITFYSDRANPRKSGSAYRVYFYNRTMSPTFFVNFGLVLKFGKTRAFYNDKNLYDAIDLNNTIGGGDNNISNGNTQIPIPAKQKAQDFNLKSVQDLIDYNDF